MKVRDSVWWVKRWEMTDGGQVVNKDDISKHGIFRGCGLSLAGDLILYVDYCGKDVTGRIARLNMNRPNLGRVHDFLSDYIGSSMSAVEDLDVQPDQFKTR